MYDKYLCKQCDYQAAEQKELDQAPSISIFRKYICLECVRNLKQRWYLTVPKKAEHLDAKYRCAFKATK
jgi:hypothetical protein